MVAIAGFPAKLADRLMMFDITRQQYTRYIEACQYMNQHWV
jgi:hypothetical protein